MFTNYAHGAGRNHTSSNDGACTYLIRLEEGGWIVQVQAVAQE